jgi:hypothetical protein
MIVPALEIGETAQEIMDDLPVYLWDDPSIRGLVGAVGAELQRIDEYLAETRCDLNVTMATGEMLAYWENFLDLPRGDGTVPDQLRLNTILAAVKRRYAGQGEGWHELLSTVLNGATWEHAENTDLNGDYARYELALFNVDVETTDYRAGAVIEMAKAIQPAHIELAEVEIAGDDTFRVGISELGETI